MRRRVHGVIVSTELILILAAVIILTFVATLGLGRVVMSQATSSKATISLTEAHVWVYRAGTRCTEIVVQAYVTNLGSKPVVVDEIRLSWAPRTGSVRWKDIPVDIPNEFRVINPGETKVISGYKKYRDFTCYSAYTGYYYDDTIMVSILYHIQGEAGTRTMTLAKPVPVEFVVTG